MIKRSSRPWKLVCLLPTLAAACESARETGPYGLRSAVEDSAGIAIVNNERPPPDSRLPWEIGAQPSLSIGSVDGGGADQLYYVLDATRLPDGRIAIANAGSSEIRVFHPDGSHSATWGGRGEGPGEFDDDAPVAVGLWPGDSIAAPNGRAERLSIFAANGSHGRDMALEARRVDFWAFLPGGRTVVSGRWGINAYTTGSSGLLRQDVEWSILGADGKLEASLGEFPDVEMWVTFAPGSNTMRGYPFGRRTVGAAWGELVAIGDQATYEIKAFAADGKLVRIVRRDGDLESPTRADADAYWEREYANEPPDRRAESLRAVKDMPLAESYPAFSGILSDRLDHLWVQERWTSVWTVFDREGRVRGLAETPSGLRVFEIGRDYVLGLARDELGVEYVEVWALERGA